MRFISRTPCTLPTFKSNDVLSFSDLYRIKIDLNLKVNQRKNKYDGTKSWMNPISFLKVLRYLMRKDV